MGTTASVQRPMLASARTILGTRFRALTAADGARQPQPYSKKDDERQEERMGRSRSPARPTTPQERKARSRSPARPITPPAKSSELSRLRNLEERLAILDEAGDEEDRQILLQQRADQNGCSVDEQSLREMEADWAGGMTTQALLRRLVEWSRRGSSDTPERQQRLAACLERDDLEALYRQALVEGRALRQRSGRAG